MGVCGGGGGGISQTFNIEGREQGKWFCEKAILWVSALKGQFTVTETLTDCV